LDRFHNPPRFPTAARPDISAEEHGLHQSYTWVKTALQEAGLVERPKKRGSRRKRRPSRR
jgi:hypothetical protein